MKHPTRIAPVTGPRGHTRAELLEFGDKETLGPMMATLHRRAEAHLRKRRKQQKSKAGTPKPDADPQRLLHELQVHQLELELQNTELQEARNRLEVLVEKSVNIVHQFARDLRPTALDDLGLIATLHTYLKDFMKRTRIQVQFTNSASDLVAKLDSTTRTVFYRVAQEALTNVARHAHASQVKLSLQKLPDAFRMEITDNGRAFAVERVLHLRRGKRLGLVGMRERVEMVGGSLEVESSPGKGTTIRAQIPFNGIKARPRS